MPTRKNEPKFHSPTALFRRNPNYSWSLQHIWAMIIIGWAKSLAQYHFLVPTLTYIYIYIWEFGLSYIAHLFPSSEGKDLTSVYFHWINTSPIVNGLLILQGRFSKTKKIYASQYDVDIAYLSSTKYLSWWFFFFFSKHDVLAML